MPGTSTEPGRSVPEPRSRPAAGPASETGPVPTQQATVAVAATTPLEQRAAELRRRYGDRGFTVVIEEPFVVLGNEEDSVVARRSKSTIRWAVDKLRGQYFDRDPEHIVDIWLLGDADSFERWTKKITGEDPGTPYGFYTPTHDALIMNIATGGGTLVHELVHPFVASNFPDCPSWFNEGLASLYEQCGEHDGKIWGYTNWRLVGLQEAIVAGSVPSFRTLTATDSHAFYELDPGTNYSQARYLCFYLQEAGLLGEYYHRFASNRDRDPSGYTTLKAVLETDDMRGFQRSWERYVSKLRFG
jgi:hypothetical protein